VSLDTIEILILDEVDRMLDMGFLPDVRRIVEKTPRARQTLFFSATMPPQIKGLAEWALREPETAEVGIRFSPAETVSHYLYPVARDQREELLLELLRRTDFHSVMIFTRTKMDADRLFAAIQRDGEHKVAVMHGDIAQRDREKALQDFRDGQVEVIVATDVAARGLDISGVTHVINYMVPEHSEDYVHRIGRTGRAGKIGHSFTLASPSDGGLIEAIEKLIGTTIPRIDVPGIETMALEAGDGRRRGRGRGRGRGAKPSSGKPREHREDRGQREARGHREPRQKPATEHKEPRPAREHAREPRAERPHREHRPEHRAEHPRSERHPKTERRQPDHQDRDKGGSPKGLGDHVPAFLARHSR
jgi:superfamily II DNA/RNA helicase